MIEREDGHELALPRGEGKGRGELGGQERQRRGQDGDQVSWPRIDEFLKP